MTEVKAKAKRRGSTKVVSFALSKEAAERLKLKETHTRFVGSVVEKALGLCPCCHQSWPEKAPGKGEGNGQQ